MGLEREKEEGGIMKRKVALSKKEEEKVLMAKN